MEEEETSIGEGSRVGFRFEVAGAALPGGLKVRDGCCGREASGSSSSSAYESELSSTASSSLSSTIFEGAGFRLAGAADLRGAAARLLSDSVVGIRGT